MISSLPVIVGLAALAPAASATPDPRAEVLVAAASIVDVFGRHDAGARVPLFGDSIIGTWLLESIVDTLADGTVSRWVSAAGDSITHFVETSMRPSEVGATNRRAIRIVSDRLIISLRPVEDGVARHRVLTWRRAS